MAPWILAVCRSSTPRNPTVAIDKAKIISTMVTPSWRLSFWRIRECQGVLGSRAIVDEYVSVSTYLNAVADGVDGSVAATHGV